MHDTYNIESDKFIIQSIINGEWFMAPLSHEPWTIDNRLINELSFFKEKYRLINELSYYSL